MNTAKEDETANEIKEDSKRRIKHLLQENRDLAANENYLKCVNEFTTDLLKASSISDVLWIITTYLIEKFGFEDCVVYLLDEESQCMVKAASHSVSEHTDRIVKNYIAIPIGDGIVGTVAKTGKPEIINDTTKDSRYIIDDASRKSELTVPIISNDKVIGVIDSENKLQNFYNEHHLETLIAIANLSAIKIDNLLVSDREHKQNQELERINSELERFVYHVTHDLKSPLSNLQGLMSLAQTESNPEVLAEMFSHMSNSVNEMAEFIEEILSYSRNVNLDVKLEKFEFLPFITQVIEAHRYLEHADQIDFRLEIDDKLVLTTDMNRLRVIMNNLVSNAIKYHDLSKNDPFVLVKASPQQDGVEIEVTDNGLGMTKTEMNKVFDMFYRIANYESKASGTGVGLYILKETVNKIGGKILLESKKNKGSTFKLWLPLAEG